MTQGGPLNATTTIVHQIYKRAFTDFFMGYAASESMILLIISSVIIFLNFRYGRRGEDVSL
jgi:multiple sugar transport system permease protein/raffinose/stachyose/melibiose transport system permease protein